MKIIEITIDTKGQTTVQTKGFAGSSCREASKALEQALGLRSSEQLTAEFHENTQTQTETRNQAGS
jgi:hypothetical protein